MLFRTRRAGNARADVAVIDLIGATLSIRVWPAACDAPALSDRSIATLQLRAREKGTLADASSMAMNATVATMWRLSAPSLPPSGLSDAF